MLSASLNKIFPSYVPSIRLIQKAADSVELHVKRGKSLSHASNMAGVLLVEAAMVGHF